MDRLDKLNEADRDQTSANLRPRDAATVVIVDQSNPSPRVLMGRRHSKQVFMPGKFVFPGGRVDGSDSRIIASGDLHATDMQRLLHDMKGRASDARARALALAAIRETFEETGLVLGKADTNATPEPLPSPSWQTYFAQSATPDLGGMALMARAITPPKRPRRYDTRFFVTTTDHALTDIQSGDGELSDLQWFTTDEALNLDIPPITRVIIEDLMDRLKQGSVLDRTTKIPYYFQQHGTFRRELID